MQDALTSTSPSMNKETAYKSRREFVAEMRAKGFKRVVRWVPDMENPEVKAEYLRQLGVLAERQRRHGPVDFLAPEEDYPVGSEPGRHCHHRAVG